MSNFLALQELTAADLNDHFTLLADESVQNTSGTTTSTTYTPTLTGGTACGLSFTAPPSGKVLIHNNSVIVNNTAAILTYCSIYVRTGSTIGSGTDVLVASDAFAVQHPGTSEFRAGASKLITGLTPGSVYNVQQVFRVGSASTGTFKDKNLIVETR